MNIGQTQRHPLLPERYSHTDVLDWLQNEIKADPELAIAWIAKVSKDDSISREDRIELLTETILEMAEALHDFTPEGSKESQAATNIIQLIESIES